MGDQDAKCLLGEHVWQRFLLLDVPGVMTEHGTVMRDNGSIRPFVYRTGTLVVRAAVEHIEHRCKHCWQRKPSE